MGKSIKTCQETSQKTSKKQEGQIPMNEIDRANKDVEFNGVMSELKDERIRLKSKSIAIQEDTIRILRNTIAIQNKTIWIQTSALIIITIINLVGIFS